MSCISRSAVFLSLLLCGCASNTIDQSPVLEYEVVGSGDQVVLFDAGSLSGMAGWDSIWGSLPDNITAIRYSRRGEGGSSNCTGQLTVDDYVDDLEDLLVKLDVQSPFVYVAHSLGAIVSRAYSARNPGQVSAMLLLDPPNPRDLEIKMTVDEVRGGAEIQRVRAEDYQAGSGKWCFLDVIWDKSRPPGFAEMGDLPVTQIAGVKKVENPQRIFDSDKAKRLWGLYQSEWVNEFPRGRALVSERSGHFVQDDEPELVIKELTRLLDSLAEN